MNDDTNTTDAPPVAAPATSAGRNASTSSTTEKKLSDTVNAGSARPPTPAHGTTPWRTPPVASATAAAMDARPAGSARSPTITVSQTRRASSSARSTPTTTCPSACNAEATAQPIPELAPVTQKFPTTAVFQTVVVGAVAAVAGGVRSVRI